MSEQASNQYLACQKCRRVIQAGGEKKPGDRCGATLGNGGEVPASGTCDGKMVDVTLIIEHGTCGIDPKTVKVLIEGSHACVQPALSAEFLACDKCGEIDDHASGLRTLAGARHFCGGTYRPISKREYMRRKHTRRLSLRAETLAALEPMKPMVTMTQEEYLKLMRDSGRGRALACYILGRTEELKIATDYRSAVEAVRGKCNEEVAHG